MTGGDAEALRDQIETSGGVSFPELLLSLLTHDADYYNPSYMHSTFGVEIPEQFGAVRWNKSRGGVLAGTIAGCVWVGKTTAGRAKFSWHFNLYGKLQKLSRTIWILEYREQPKGMIDHINGNPLDNRLSNLRDTTNKQNQENRRSANVNSATGVRGVHKSGNKFCAVVKHHGVWHRSYHATIEEAEVAVIAMRKELFTHDRG